MNFSVLKARVAGEVGLDATADDTLLGVWVNAAYKHVCGLYNWPWLVKPGTVQTVTDITTGTVAINAASTSLTFSSGPAVSVASQYMIQFSEVSDDWYNISAHTAAATSATLATAFAGASNLTADDYICRKVLYSLPSDCDRIISIREAVNDHKLYPVDIRTFDHELPDPTATGTPLFYSVVGLDSSNYWQVTLYPIPDAKVNLQIRYLQIPADMATTNNPVLPEKFHDVIVWCALFMYGHPYIDDSRVSSAKARFDQRVADMKRQHSPVPDHGTVLRPWDSRGGASYPGTLPPNYPYPWRS